MLTFIALAMTKHRGLDLLRQLRCHRGQHVELLLDSVNSNNIHFYEDGLKRRLAFEANGSKGKHALAQPWPLFANTHLVVNPA